MILLRLISWPYLRKHALRSLLTLLGVVFGVAVFLSMQAADAAVLQGFRETVNRIAGATQLQVSVGGTGMDESILERVQAVPGVKVAVPVIEAVVGTGLAGQGNLLVLGVDMTGDRSLRDYDMENADDALIEDPLVFLAQPDSLMVTSQFAARNHVALDQKIPLQTAEGVKQFTVRGVLKSQGLNTAFGGNLAIMDIYAAQHVFGRGRKFDRIDLAVNDGLSVEQVQARLHQALGEGYEVEPPSTRAQSLESMTRIYSIMLKFSSGIALLIACFIIYNAFAIAVTQRRSEIGILRALGATRRQITMLFLGESVVGGLIGSAIGILCGQALATLVTRVIASILEGAYGVAHTEVKASLSPALVGFTLAVGVGTSVLAAFLPSRSAARVDPVKALQKGQVQVLSAGENRFRLVAALVLSSCGVVLVFASQSLRAVYGAYICMVAGALLLTPKLSLLLSRALRPLMTWLRPVEGALAADSLIGAPRRTSATVAALMISLAQVIALGGSARSAYRNIAEWVNSSLSADLFVSSSPTVTERAYRFPESMAGAIEQIPGVAEVHVVRNFRVRFRDALIMINVLEMRKRAARVRSHVVEGNEASMMDAAAQGRGVVISENLSALQHLHLGDRIDLRSPAGIVTMPIVGVIRDYTDQQGSVMIDRAFFKQHWNDDSADLFRVYLTPDTTPEKVKEAILARFSVNHRIFVLTSGQVRDHIFRLTNQWFNLTTVQSVVAILVAVFGIINSLTVSIIDRRRELGVLQAVGGLRNQIRGTLWMEAAAVAAISLLLGLALGALQLHYSLQMSYRNYPGMKLDYLYPTGVALVLIPVMLVVAFAAALAPAESAVRGSLIEALQYE